MKKYLLKNTVLLLAVTGLLVAQDSPRGVVLSHIIKQNLSHVHFSPLPIDDDFSQRAYKLFIERLDYTKRFLYASDIGQLVQYQKKFDDELQAGRMEIYQHAFSLLKRRILEAQEVADQILSQPFDFYRRETLEMDSEKRQYCQNPKEFKDRWRQILKYQTLLRYFDLMEKQQKGDSTASSPAILPEFKELSPDLEKQAREMVAQSVRRSLKRLLERKEEDRLSVYINSLTNCFDPHTVYFPPEEKEDFDIKMTGQLEGIGAVLQEEDAYIKVVRIVPGSASWRQKELQAGDIILKVAQADGEPEDIVDMPLREAVNLIRGKKGTQVRLTVRKPDGQIRVIAIVRDVVVIEEAYARSALIQSDRARGTYGYLYLPNFYHDFQQTGSRNSADDIERELEKLTRARVDGVILDLRTNGGGSLVDAVKMAGLFISKGPIVQVKDKFRKGEVLRDTDPEIVYEGPLVIMLSSGSASASEIVAAALQDYGRALIVGTEHSFGKGTVQRMLDLDSFLYFEHHHLKPLGSLKITIQKFYRINGGTTQYKGVEPDILLPDPYSSLESGERSLDYPLPWDTVAPLSYKKWDKPVRNITQLAGNSRQRVEQSPAFQVIRENLERLKARREQSQQPLHIKEFRGDQKRYQEQAEKFKKLQEQMVNLTVTALPEDLAEIKDVPEQKERLQEWHNELKSDVYIEEVMQIMDEMEF